MPAPEVATKKGAKGGGERLDEAERTTAGAVLDLCALAPAKGGATFVKQRVVLFAPAGLGQALQDGAARAAGGADLVKDVFLARFPLKRFHSVISETPAPVAWADRGSLASSEVSAAVEEDAASSFLAYSAACSDYLAVPIVRKVEITRKPVKVKDKQGRERTVEQLSVAATATLSLYRRTATGFVLHARLEASAPSAADMVSDFGAASFSVVEGQANRTLGAFGAEALTTGLQAATQPAHISGWPLASCAVPKLARENVPGLGSCGKAGVGRAFLVGEAIDERLGAACKAAAADGENKEKALVCELRVRSFQLARSLQKAARSVDGWNLFDVLLRGSFVEAQGLGIALGDSEGVSVGHAFQVRDKSGERVGFLKVTDVGPGGEAGRRRRSHLELRAGDAPVGSRAEEYPMMGITLWGMGGGGVLSGNWGTTTVADRVSFRLPELVGGGGALAGFDLSPHLGITEAHLRAGGSVAVGKGRNTALTMFTIDTFFEKGVYLAPRVSAFAGLGASFVFGSVKLESTAHTREAKVSTTVFGPAGTLGLDFLLLPEVSLRLAMLGRAPVTRARYEEDEPEKPVDGATASAEPTGASPVPDWSRRNDHLLSLQGAAGLVVGF